jgi:acyl-CoA reductase-like NAD-dependent aldehyde dehydrogenase
MTDVDAAALAAGLALRIGGQAVPVTDSFVVVNPATGEVFAHAPKADAGHVDAAMAAAAAAYPAWRQDDDARRDHLLKAADAVDAAAEEIAVLMAAEQGKVLSVARSEVVHSGAAWLRYYAGLELPREIVKDDARGFTEIVREPLGVVAAITPWNYPIALASWKIAPALRAGNTVVLKPSPYTPLSSLRLVAALDEVLPPGVVNIVTGTDEISPVVAGHPIARKVSFTGSIATGRQVGAAAAADLKRLTLELGGNDPAILLDDVNVEAVADEILAAAFINSGQVCMAVKRVYAPASRYDDVVEAFARRAAALVVGDPFEPTTTMGPLSNRMQLDKVSELVAEAVADGAVAVTGGHRIDRPGFFYAPTVLRAEDGMRVVDEEQFGPVLPVVAHSGDDDAVRRANGTPYGLTASVWSADGDRAEAVARRLDAGKVAVNTHTGGTGPHLPFAGHRHSGLGVENGVEGLHGFTDLKVVYRKR